MVWHPSPNHGERRGAVDLLVLHYTGMPTTAGALARLSDPDAQVSAHYLVGTDGTVWQLVAEHRRAWHAGLACWRGEHDVNSHSIGVEIAHPGHAFGYRPFPAAQIAAVQALCRGIVARHGIPARNVVGHSDVAPNRKEDPGEGFPWPAFAAAGIGLSPRSCAPLPVPPLVRVQAALAAFGYDLAPNGSCDLATRNAVLAFQRHFRPACLDGVFDGDCAGRLADLLRQCGCEPAAAGLSIP
ncbi:MAG: N-acetylmuramoyl-L-alanine amidase [Alphaproteobacteria bacterium]|nr:N-acetylmuramoyl-L-alanine amidase [Alphaproteobacteria bacterium]MCB9928931.1 N-acetylmuramoyl-L-alanine amidase [Alphaproteobacteria bacterium]